MAKKKRRTSRPKAAEDPFPFGFNLIKPKRPRRRKPPGGGS
jgi:hypothetical protein